VAAVDLGAIAEPVLRETILARRAWLTERGTWDAAACAALAPEALDGDEPLHNAWRRVASTSSVLTGRDEGAGLRAHGAWGVRGSREHC
jgi:hypothetical protein